MPALRSLSLSEAAPAPDAAERRSSAGNGGGGEDGPPLVARRACPPPPKGRRRRNVRYLLRGRGEGEGMLVTRPA